MKKILLLFASLFVFSLPLSVSANSLADFDDSELPDWAISDVENYADFCANMSVSDSIDTVTMGDSNYEIRPMATTPNGAGNVYGSDWYVNVYNTAIMGNSVRITNNGSQVSFDGCTTVLFSGSLYNIVGSGEVGIFINVSNFSGVLNWVNTALDNIKSNSESVAISNSFITSWKLCGVSNCWANSANQISVPYNGIVSVDSGTLTQQPFSFAVTVRWQYVYTRTNFTKVQVSDAVFVPASNFILTCTPGDHTAWGDANFESLHSDILNLQTRIDNAKTEIVSWLGMINSAISRADSNNQSSLDDVESKLNEIWDTLRQTTNGKLDTIINALDTFYTDYIKWMQQLHKDLDQLHSDNLTLDKDLNSFKASFDAFVSWFKTFNQDFVQLSGAIYTKSGSASFMYNISSDGDSPLYTTLDVYYYVFSFVVDNSVSIANSLYDDFLPGYTTCTKLYVTPLCSRLDLYSSVNIAFDTRIGLYVYDMPGQPSRPGNFYVFYSPFGSIQIGQENKSVQFTSSDYEIGSYAFKDVSDFSFTFELGVLNELDLYTYSYTASFCSAPIIFDGVISTPTLNKSPYYNLYQGDYDNIDNASNNLQSGIAKLDQAESQAMQGASTAMSNYDMSAQVQGLKNITAELTVIGTWLSQYINVSGMWGFIVTFGILVAILSAVIGVYNYSRHVSKDGSEEVDSGPRNVDSDVPYFNKKG